MTKRSVYNIVNYFIASVWIINGLFCKVFSFVPRHEQIIARILGGEYSRLLAISIGFAEVLMAIWILSRIKTRLNVITQILIISTMNILEFMLVPDLLLWGKANTIFALIFILIILYNEFVISKKAVNIDKV